MATVDSKMSRLALDVFNQGYEKEKGLRKEIETAFGQAEAGHLSRDELDHKIYSYMTFVGSYSSVVEGIGHAGTLEQKYEGIKSGNIVKMLADESQRTEDSKQYWKQLTDSDLAAKSITYAHRLFDETLRVADELRVGLLADNPAVTSDEYTKELADDSLLYMKFIGYGLHEVYRTMWLGDNK